MYRPLAWLSPRLTLATFSQSHARWNGIRDPNSGLVSFNANLTVSFSLPGGLSVTPGYRMPVYQRTLEDGGDTFTYGPTFLLDASFERRTSQDHGVP